MANKRKTKKSAVGKKTAGKAKTTKARPGAKRIIAQPAATKVSLQYVPWHTIPLEELNPLLQRQFVVGQEIMLARVLLKKGCIVPEHSHYNEQVTYILDGALKFWIDGKEIVVHAGEVLCIPAHMPHKAEALEDTVDLDVFTPPRASDWGSNQQTSQSAAADASCMFRCIGCDATVPTAAQDFRCAHCGNLLEITSPAWTSSAVKADILKSTWRARRSSNEALDLSGVWRYRELLPNPALAHHVVTLREGNTPLYELPRCARLTGVPRLFAKHQGLNPTGSFKDTGMTVAATFARQAGCNWVACASTGNTSASMAAYAARAGMRSLVLVPEGKISWSKLSQALDYGALTCQLRTNFDGCLQLLQQLVKQAPVYQLNSINPFRLEGQKTHAIELLEQLDWQPPDHIIVPGGNL